ncbi:MULTISPECIES: outer membrane protein [unclassified Bartonella]|uniref:outer membrane protein n=1 Tax=unclassified Bartonella TaxID=2645622 RepID=UPI00099A9F3E|nr:MULTISPECIES: outer membrane protein [unclassified Bartonella]AQX27489.1 outer membrane immunogenic protein [Bartonella sp. JB15]AQX28770.1 outer membrane immunogenic protein [Bartonella sp. JB63]
MNMKCLMTASVVALMTASAVQAADITVPQEVGETIVVVPAFSWTGFYLGGQIGGFSSKTSFSSRDGDDSKKWLPLHKDLWSKPSGFTGGVYAGSNVDLGNGLILGVDTDVIWSGRKDTKNRKVTVELKDEGENQKKSFPLLNKEGSKPEKELETIEYGHTLKEKWAGATRIRIGFAADRIMPYVAGGVAYTQLQDSFLMSVTKKKVPGEPAVGEPAVKVEDDKEPSAELNTNDESKTMIGYTLGAGVDFAMTDNVILRAEYRYSDFGKKKLHNEKLEVNYKANDFRVGVAYKF